MDRGRGRERVREKGRGGEGKFREARPPKYFFPRTAPGMDCYYSLDGSPLRVLSRSV